MIELSLFVDFTVKTMNESMCFWIAVVLFSNQALTPATGSGAEDFAGTCLSTYKKTRGDSTKSVQLKTLRSTLYMRLWKLDTMNQIEMLKSEPKKSLSSCRWLFVYHRKKWIFYVHSSLIQQIKLLARDQMCAFEIGNLSEQQEVTYMYFNVRLGVYYA